VRANKVPPHYANPPGYFPVEANMRFARGTTPPVVAFLRQATIDWAVEMGFVFMGTPDKVYAQLKRFYDHVGGFGHLLIMGQAGFLDHDETVHGIRTFAREVLPRLRAECPDLAASGFADEVAAAAG
jgi:alkanesulfonate monooxygenase SsuD/methylene tetrahydromethanopterin reductase-like flavin-dependent oxidoreductase (luciferase family)